MSNDLADKLQKESEHFSGAQDLVGMLLDAGAALRNLHTENTALRVTEDNLRQELQECQAQRQAAFRRIEELERQLEEARKDAERYQFVRSGNVYIEPNTAEIYMATDAGGKYYKDPRDMDMDIDEAIDAAMKGTP